MNILKNKYFILGNILLLLAVIPITLFIIKRQTDLKSNAAPTTTLSFSPTSVNTSVNKTFKLDIFADPGENAVSIIEMTIKVDPAKLQIVSLEKNSAVLPVTLVEPQINGGTVSLTASTSNNVAEAIQEKTKVATLTLKALTTTTGSPTLVTFDQPSSQVFSIASSDGKTENVLNSTESSSVTIAESGGTGGNGGSNGGNTGGNGGSNGGGNNGSNGSNGGNTGSLSPTPGQKPVCTGLFLDRSAVGTAPYSLVLTASGNQPGGVISKVTFTFGDGVVQEVTQAGGVGTSSVNVQISHTYNNPGSYPASVTMTDSTGKISESTTCKQTITISAPSSSGATGRGTSTGSGSGTIVNTGGTTNQGGVNETGGATGGSGSVPATGTLEVSLAIIGVVGTLLLTGAFFLL